MAAIQINGKWCFIAGEVKNIVEPRYDDGGNFHDAMTFIKINDKYGFIGKEGMVKISPRFKDVWDFSEGLAAVANDKHNYGYINKDGKLIIPF